MPKKIILPPEKIESIYKEIKLSGYRKSSEKYGFYISFLQRLVKRYEKKKKIGKYKMKAIIIAAGMGSRLNDMTKYIPKPLIEIDGKSLLERELDLLHSLGIRDISIIRGYQKEKINLTGIKFYDNDNFQNNNILESLFYAEEEMDDAFICTYSDLIFSRQVIKKIIEAPYEICIGVDTNWFKHYVDRSDHPTDEAELVQVKDGLVTKISKFFNPETAFGEFIGIAKFSKKGAEIFKRNYHRIKENIMCRFADNQRFHDAISFQKAYLTDMFTEIIEKGYPINAVEVQNGWIEIDTKQDYEYACKQVREGKL